MKRFIFLVYLFIACLQANGQTWTNNICYISGSNVYSPMYSTTSANATSRAAMIIPATQLQPMSGKALTSMYFLRYSTTGTMTGTPNFKIYIKEVANADWGASALDWATATTGSTLVYDNNPSAIVGSAEGWKSFPLSTPFTYSGTQNLAVFMEYRNTSASESILWNFEANAPCVDTSNNNTFKYSNNATGTYPATLANSNFRRPQIGFDFATTCPAPSGLTATGVTSNSINLAWTTNGAESEWAYVIQPQGTGYPTGSGTQMFSNPYTAGGLNPATNYEVYIRANCGTGNSSYWVGPINFTTNCVPITVLPHLEPFNTFVPNLCWTEADNGDLTLGPALMGSGSWVADGLGNASATGAFRAILDGTGDNDWVISPEFAIPASGYEMKFLSAANQSALTSAPTIPWESDDYVEVLATTTGYTNWVVLHTFNDTNVSSNVGSINLIDLDAYAGQNVRFAFRAVEGPTNGTAAVDFSIDDFEIRQTPSCLEPTGLITGSITGASADISWNIGNGVVGYEYVLDNVATNPIGSGTFTSNSFYSASGLNGLTTYYFHVRTDCGSGNFSSWSTTSFTTGCAVITTLPQFEPFDTFPPTICWREADNGDLITGPATFDSGNWIIDGFGNVGGGGAIRITIDAAVDNDWVLSPQYAIPTTGYELKYLSAANQTGMVNAPTTPWESDDFVEVLVSTTDNSNWTVLYTHNNTNVPSHVGSSTILDLDAYAGQNVRFAFRAVEGANNGNASIDFFIDNFELRLSPSCSETTGLVSGNITGTTANISWNSVSGAAGYEYVLDNVATNPSGSGVFTSNAFYPASSLSGNTLYYFHVRTDCGSGNFSAWSTTSFTTLCTPVVTFPHVEQFNTFLPNACWNEGDNGDLLTGPGVFGTGSWSVDGLGNVGTTGAIRATLDATGDNDWVVSPEFTIPATGYELRFLAAANQVNVTTSPTTPWESDDVVEVLVSTSGNVNWSVLYTYNNTNVPSNVGEQKIIDLDAFAGQNVRIAFRAVEGVLNGSAAIDFSVDNFEIVETTLTANSFEKESFAAYPNPVKDILNLAYKTPITKVNVFNLLGQEVLDINFNNNDVQINMSSLTPGAYIVNVTIDETLHKIKIIKE